MDAQVADLHLPARRGDGAQRGAAFLQALTAYYGKRPVIYTTVDFFATTSSGDLDGYPFWLRSVAGHPSEVYPGQRWAFWQYTGTGLVDGIDGLTDLNVFAGSFQQIVNLAERRLTAAAPLACRSARIHWCMRCACVVHELYIEQNAVNLCHPAASGRLC